MLSNSSFACNFFSFFILLKIVTYFEKLLKEPCIPRINPTWLGFYTHPLASPLDTPKYIYTANLKIYVRERKLLGTCLSYIILVRFWYYGNAILNQVWKCYFYFCVSVCKLESSLLG